jgi:hypothetical protein
MIQMNARSTEMRASVFGAGILGFGLGVIFAGFARPYAFFIILLGIGLHSWGMYGLYADGKKDALSNALYWFCWLVLAVLAGYVAIRLLA